MFSNAPGAIGIVHRFVHRRWKSLISGYPSSYPGLQSREELESIRDAMEGSGAPTREQTLIPCYRCGLPAPSVVGPTCGWFIAGTSWNACWWAIWKSVVVEQKLGYAVLWRCQAKALYFARRGLLGNVVHGKLPAAGGGAFWSFWRREVRIARYLRDLRADSPLRGSLKREPGILFRQNYFATQRHNALQFPPNFEDYFRVCLAKTGTN